MTHSQAADRFLMSVENIKSHREVVHKCGPTVGEYHPRIYKHVDGQGPDSLYLFGEFQFLSLKESQDHWPEMYSACSVHEADCTDKRLKDGSRWRQNWFPVAWAEYPIAYLMVDFDPSPQGTFGQVFAWFSGEAPRRFLAASIPEFLEDRLNEMANSSFELDEEQTFFHWTLPLIQYATDPADHRYRGPR